MELVKHHQNDAAVEEITIGSGKILMGDSYCTVYMPVTDINTMVDHIQKMIHAGWKPLGGLTSIHSKLIQTLVRQA